MSREVELSVGDSLLVALCSNPSTGFQWESAKISDEAVLQQVEHRFQPPSGDAVGAAGREEWTFEAAGKGRSTVSVDYSRPWQGGEKGVWTFILTVTVK